MGETILIVDDEEDILELIEFNLASEGYDTLTATTGEQAISLTRRADPDLIVLDLMLPGIDGLEVTRYLRGNADTRNIPIVMLTARGEETDVITGLESGVNDYMSKPFSPKILIARIRAALRAREDSTAPFIPSARQSGSLLLDRARYTATIDGKPIHLTLTEFELLSFLSAKKGWVFTRGQIVDAIHGDDYAVTERSIDVIIVGIRKKLKKHANLIETVRGVGYRFKED